MFAAADALQVTPPFSADVLHPPCQLDDTNSDQHGVGADVYLHDIRAVLATAPLGAIARCVLPHLPLSFVGVFQYIALQ